MILAALRGRLQWSLVSSAITGTMRITAMVVFILISDHASFPSSFMVSTVTSGWSTC